jgi:hypothetical protein
MTDGIIMVKGAAILAYDQTILFCEFVYLKSKCYFPCMVTNRRFVAFMKILSDYCRFLENLILSVSM